VIALEVSSAGRPGSHGGVPGTIRNLVGALLRTDRETRYALCTRLSRWTKGHGMAPEQSNACARVLQDPFNDLLLPGVRLFHSMGVHLPLTPRVPKLVTIHDLNAVRNAHWVREHWHQQRSARIRQVLARADHVVTYSEYTAGEICEVFDWPAERVHAVPLGVDCERFRPPQPDEITALRREYGDYVMAVGLFTPRKNLPVLVEALAALPQLQLVLVGRPSDGSAELEASIERAGIRPRVRLLSNLPSERLSALIGAARVFAVPSLYEGFGLTALEAMACGVPVVCSQASSLPEVAGDAALLVDARSSEALAEAIRRVVDDEPRAADMRRRGLARARELSWESSARALRALYRALAR
jgi:glycosyltransferase involved in cell wall biosynthesis